MDSNMHIKFIRVYGKRESGVGNGIIETDTYLQTLSKEGSLVGLIMVLC